MTLRRDLAQRSTTQWAVICGCVFVITMGAGLGTLTPPPDQRAKIADAFRSPFADTSRPASEVV